LPTPKSVCYISNNNTYSASFNGAKDAAYTAKYGQPLEMKEGKGRGGRGRGRFATREWKGEERKGKEGREGTGIKEGEGGDRGLLRCKGVGRRGEEGKGRRNGELTLTPEP